MKNLFALSIIFLVSTTLFSCKKKAEEDPAPASEVGKFRIEFEHLVGEDPLEFNTANTQYTNNLSETFNVTMFKYYISNVILKKADGSEYVVPESYFLIDAANPTSSLITVKGIPVGNYKSIKFTLGVDSTRNVSGSQTGALDPANAMFWSWNNGYIFLKMEGTSPQSTEMDNMYMYHIGGFKNANNTNALQTVERSFGMDVLRISTTGNPQIHMMVDASEVLKTPTDISFATTAMVHMPGALPISIAENYADMFTVDHIHD